MQPSLSPQHPRFMSEFDAFALRLSLISIEEKAGSFR